MPRAEWNGKVLAEATSEECQIVEGNIYFPPSAIHKEYFRNNDKNTFCPWKGHASYYDVVVEGEVNQACAWYYPIPYDKAKHIKDHVAFWQGVKVTP
ncbi:uncharacterized protein VTP21DRAFT_9661 [Calcarisporiella thermophila]|uniref:uncharacterized protein n=1 Tax=Calcarisporiella thermophila TaxID=911321 RepID=UPI0037427E06